MTKQIKPYVVMYSSPIFGTVFHTVTSEPRNINKHNSTCSKNRLNRKK